jgi:hypothetical protein
MARRTSDGSLDIGELPAGGTSKVSGTKIFKAVSKDICSVDMLGGKVRYSQRRRLL